jgi:replicative DNA helicase
LITESFLNSCFTVILNKQAKIKRTKALYRDILEILVFSEQRQSVDIPMAVESKLDCLKKICELLLSDKTLDNVLDSIAFSEKFNQHRDFLDVKSSEELKEHVIQDCIKQIRLRKKINALFQNYDDLNDVLESIKDGSFDSIDDLVDDYEITIKKLYSNMMESNRAVTIEAAASLDLVKDDYRHVTEMIMKKYDRSNKTPSGFTYIDNKVLHGGYEPSRLYIWGGGSGAGKSTMLNNTIINSAITNPALMVPNAPRIEAGKISRVYVYVTCENTIEEALMRTYMPLFDRTIPQMLTDISQGGFEYIKKQVYDRLANNGSTIVMKYFPATTISAFDLMGVIDDVIELYGEKKIRGLYIDYLDLLKADSKYDIYRMELGHITLSLKTLAVQYNIPVITATQLGRSAYKINNSYELNVDQISESIKKVEHADFVGLLAKDEFDTRLVHGKVGKNRAGESGLSVDCAVDFSRFKFINIGAAARRDKADATTKNKKNKGLSNGIFDGMDTL